MSVADDIIAGRMPDFEDHLRQGHSLDDTDEYGLNFLIEATLTQRPNIVQDLLARKVTVDKPDITGRTALHWAIDQHDIAIARTLLENGANANAYTRGGLSVLVYPILRRQEDLKSLLYQYGAKLDFAQDFILAKLLGHRYELQGDVDIYTPEGKYIELDYEGFFLEFTVALILNSLRRFTNSYATRDWRPHYPVVYAVIEAFALAGDLLQLQEKPRLSASDKQNLQQYLQAPLHIFPVASEGHAIGFVHYGKFWAKIDRGENSLKEGSINIYEMRHPERLTVAFLEDFLYNKQSREYFHEQINSILGLQKITTFPMTAQITGNCSWANIQATIPVAIAFLMPQTERHWNVTEAMALYEAWVEWDQDRALEECVQRFYLADPIRKASIASMLGAVLFQACEYGNKKHLSRAEKILRILTLPEYHYVLDSYLKTYCVHQLTRKGNNLLKILDDAGVDSGVEVNPIATGLKKRK
ncbi:MAG: ankyrin repeat domain-containing protein [Legionellaceae bacterium]|nr:ankyrin repeat domain-containing protein [Legionellaceae bacterium]